MNIGEAIAQDLRAMFDSPDFVTEVADEMGRVHKESIITQSNNAEGADGSKFQELSSPYKEHKQRTTGRSSADLRYGVKQGESLELLDFYSTNEETLYDFGGDIRRQNYMTDHQQGNNNMPQRRWFPDDNYNDGETAPQKQNAQEVERVLGEYLNKDRTIIVGHG